MNKHRVNVQKILREAAADAEVLAKKKGHRSWNFRGTAPRL